MLWGLLNSPAVSATTATNYASPVLLIPKTIATTVISVINYASPVTFGSQFLDWLANVWPTYRQVFEQVFVGAREHHIGHSSLFFIVGLLVLVSFPTLRSRPLLYFGLMLTAALTQEAVQDLFKFLLPDLAEGLDLLFDAVGFTIAYLVVWGWKFSQD